MGRGAYAQRASEGGSGGGDVTGVTGTLPFFVITNSGGPVPNVNGNQTDAANPDTLVSRDANAQSDFRSIEIRTAALALRGTVFESGFLTVQSAVGASGLILETLAGPAILRNGVGGVQLWATQTDAEWFFNSQLCRTDTLSQTGTWAEVYNAKNDGFVSSWARRDEDTAPAGYHWLTQQPAVGATGTNRDSGSAAFGIQTPNASGRWGQTATQWPGSAAPQTVALVEDREHHGVVNTTDATVTNVAEAQSDDLPASSSATVFVKFKVRNTATDASRTIVKIMHWGRTGAGAPTQRGATATVFDDGDAIAVTTTVVATGNALVPQFTGVAGTNLRASVEMVVSRES